MLHPPPPTDHSRVAFAFLLVFQGCIGVEQVSAACHDLRWTASVNGVESDFDTRIAANYTLENVGTSLIGILEPVSGETFFVVVQDPESGEELLGRTHGAAPPPPLDDQDFATLPGGAIVAGSEGRMAEWVAMEGNIYQIKVIYDTTGVFPHVTKAYCRVQQVDSSNVLTLEGGRMSVV